MAKKQKEREGKERSKKGPRVSTKTKIRVKKESRVKLPQIQWPKLPYQGVYRFFLIGLFLSILLFVLTATVYHLTFSQTVYPGVLIAGIDLGGKTLPQATQALETHFPSSETQLTIINAGQTWSLPVSEIGVVYNATASAQKAFLFGRKETLKEDLKRKWQAFFKKESLLPVYNLNTKALDKKIVEFSGLVDFTPVPSTLSLQKDQVLITKGQPGQELDKERFLLLLYQRLETLDTKEPIVLPVVSLQPKFNESKAIQAQKALEKLLQEPLIFTFQELTFNLEAGEALDFFLPLEKEEILNQEAVQKFVAEIAGEIDRPPQDAVFQFASGRVAVFTPSQDGHQLDEKETIQLISQLLENNQDQDKTRGQAQKKASSVPLPVKTIKPEVTTEEVNNLGIKERIGRGISYFWGSIAPRIHNITHAASILNGILVPPNETFSFNQSLGEVSEETGYQQAYVIKSGRTILDDGGGVCQVSTTVFRAALNTGLPIIERTAHAYRVAYYEQNSQVGLDATVYEPTVDLKFKNDTPGHLLIQAIVDQKNQILIFDFYGTDDGRQATTGKSTIANQVPPPEAIYQDDSNLPKGETKQIDWPAWGAKVTFSYQVTRDNELLQDQVFVSRYRPWQAIYLVGTKEP